MCFPPQFVFSKAPTHLLHLFPRQPRSHKPSFGGKVVQSASNVITFEPSSIAARFLLPDNGTLLTPSSNQHSFIQQREKSSIKNLAFSEQCLMKELPQKQCSAKLNQANPLLLSSSQTQPATIPHVPSSPGLHRASSSSRSSQPCQCPGPSTQRGSSCPWALAMEPSTNPGSAGRGVTHTQAQQSLFTVWLLPYSFIVPFLTPAKFFWISGKAMLFTDSHLLFL